MPPASQPRDVARTMLAVLFIGLLIVSSFWVLLPFLPAIVWATMVVISTWPLMRSLQARLGGRRLMATALMCSAMLLVLILPLTLAILTIANNIETAVLWLRDFATSPPQLAPAWLAELPLVGERLAQQWNALAQASTDELSAKVAPYLGQITRWVLAQIGNFGLLLVHFLLTVVVAAMFYASGERIADGVRAFVYRLGGERGEHAAQLAAQAIRAVALGVVVTALVQSVLGGIGLAVAGVPHPALLTALMFLLGVAQIGAGLVLIPSVIWMYAGQGDAVWGTVLLVWSLVVTSLDNVLRPYLIRKGADLPLVLILAGVIGGLFAFGIIGLFIGPVMLAVTYTLLQSWVRENGGARPPSDSAPDLPPEL